jgi:hypothetical protein
MRLAKITTGTITTDGSGNATVYTQGFTGKLLEVRYLKTDFADGVDFTITVNGTGEGVWAEADVNVATIKYPRRTIHDLVGAVRTYDGTYEVAEPVYVFQDSIKIVIAQGGGAKTGAFEFIVEGE